MTVDEGKQVRRSSKVAEGGSDSFLRSDPLVLCEIVLPAEVAFECVIALGSSLDPVHIGPGNPALHRSANSLRSISGATKLCNDLQITLAATKTQLAVYQDYIRMHCSAQVDGDDADCQFVGLRPKTLFDLEANILSLQKDLMELSSYEAEMNNQYIHINDFVNVLDCLDNTFMSPKATESSSPNKGSVDFDSRVLLDNPSDNASEFSQEFDQLLPYSVGIVPTKKAHGLRLALWRRFHLTALFTDVTVRHQRDLRDQPVASHNIFMLVTLSVEQKRLADRLCGLLGARVFPVPETKELRARLADESKEKLSEMRQVFLEGEEHRKRITLNGWGKWRRWYAQLCLVQSVHRVLGQFGLDYTKQYYVGEVWCSRDSIDSVREALGEGSSKASGVKATIRLVEGAGRLPPTRMPRHAVTSAVRDIIYQFGVPRYREIDPTPFTAITFPFLFAVMFGDWGHGLLVLAFCLALFASSSSRLVHPGLAESLQPLRQIRHLLLLCALFAVYCGVVYNEGFGLTVGLRSWSHFSLENFTYAALVNGSLPNLQLLPRDTGHRMAWATDPMWGGAKNEVRFFNSARMKLSIIFGFLHLVLGMSLRLANDAHLSRMPTLVLFSLAKLLFHCLLMGYPVALIVYKWLAVRPADAACAPALLPMLIAMYRFDYPDTPCYLTAFYPGQKYVERCVVLGVTGCALLAIAGLPVYHAALSWTRKGRPSPQPMRHASLALPEGSGLDETAAATAKRKEADEGGEDEGFDLLEHFLHCFEFLLSSVSHSASYLRLWAIGLAHGELTTILWPLLLLPPTRLSASLVAWSPAAADILGGLLLAASFCLWAGVTVVILVGMEGMTALLHALRLHCIEFQTKFYSGDGYLFHPFSLKAVAAQAAESCRDFATTQE